VIGIHEVGALPAEGGHGGIRLGAQVVRLTVDDGVFAIRLVPNWKNFQSFGVGCEDGGELGFAFPGETVAHAKGEFGNFHSAVLYILIGGGCSKLIVKNSSATRVDRPAHSGFFLVIDFRPLSGQNGV